MNINILNDVGTVMADWPFGTLILASVIAALLSFAGVWIYLIYMAIKKKK